MMVKALHLQKQTAQPAASDSSFGQLKLASNAWFSNENEEDPSWASLKSQLIAYHDDAKAISTKTLVNFLNDKGGGLSSLGPTLPVDHALNLFELANEAVSLGDHHDAKAMILGAGLMLQLRATAADKIVAFVKDNESSDASYEDKLAETLPFCSDSCKATKTPDAMRAYLDELDVDELKSKLASAEPLVDLVFKDETVERKVQGINSLLTLNTVLSTYGEVSNFSAVRVKHNDTRLFLSSAGKKSLADLGVVSGDAILIEDATCSFAGVDVSNLRINSHGQGPSGGKR